VQTLTATNPGAIAAIGAFAAPTSLLPGASTALSVPVTIAGGDQYLDVADATNVTVQNVAAPSFAPALLFYDDDPERIDASGVLYRGTIPIDRPVRLYYYHENMNDPRNLYVVLTSQAVATVHVIDASAGPNMDVMTVGHAVTRNFLVQKPANEGVLVDVLPGDPLALHAFALNPLDGAAGNIDFRLTRGGPVTVTVVATPPATPLNQLAQYLSAPQLPDDTHHRGGVFSLAGYADGSDPIPYVVGGDDASLLYGAQSPPATEDNPNWHDYGEYGVLRQIAFDVSNPTQRPATVYVYESPQGGPARSSFLVDGRLYELGCARVPDKYLIATLAVGTGTERHVVTTMTDGGSNYPLEVGLTTSPPQPATPPISAPNGCFPKPS